MPVVGTFDAACDDSTWSLLVNTTALDSKRACILCGDTTLNPHRSILVTSMQDQLSFVHRDSVSTAVQNILKASADVFHAYGSTDDDARVVACMCCQHWINRRNERMSRGRADRTVLPLQALMQYVRTLQIHSNAVSSDKKAVALDARVVSRLVSTLTQDVDGRPRNYYLTLFDENERRLFYEMRSDRESNIHRLLARHYHSANANTPFFHSPNVAEAVRLSKNLSLETM